MMDLKTFEDLLDRHGAAIDAWPRLTQAAAHRLLRDSAAARLALATLEDVEAVLRADVPNLGGRTFAARATQHGQERPRSRAVRAAVWTAALVATLVIGLAIGEMSRRQADAAEPIMAAVLDMPSAADVD